MSERVWKIGLAGCGWISRVFVEAFRSLPNAEVVACCASSSESAERFAAELGIENACADWRDLVAREDVDVITVGTPNVLHHPIAVAALDAGKHVIVEKPLAMSLEEGREIFQRAQQADRVVGYAENLCFAPKYEKAREMLMEGALGKPLVIKHVEKHDGPHSAWFYQRASAGGGALMDMGCHSIELTRWLLGKPTVTAVWAHMATVLHRDGMDPRPTDLEDHAVVHLEFEGGATALLDTGWSLKGGMASRLEIQGSEGVLEADLLGDGTGMKVFREDTVPPGWQPVDADWHRENGYPQELAHFLGCMETGQAPRESAADGLAVLEIMLAAYHSAFTGRKVSLPFRPKNITHPVDLWTSPPASLDA